MKKIVRLTENDLVRLVKRVLNEQLMNYAQPKNTPQTGAGNPNLTSQPVRLYYDEANTKEAKIEAIGTIRQNSYGELELTAKGKVGNGVYTFNCKNNFISEPCNSLYCASQKIDKINYYNKKYINDLKTNYCTTSSGGTPVTNIGMYSNIDSNKPTNIA